MTMPATSASRNHKPIWKHFRRELRKRYELGDAYNETERDDFLAKGISWTSHWNRQRHGQEYKYLRYVETLVGQWPHLQLLVDFMKAGTVPMRWFDELKAKEEKGDALTKEAEEIRREETRKTRAMKSKVTLITYKEKDSPKLTQCTVNAPKDLDDKDNLTNVINMLKRNQDKTTTLHLFVVEDLSLNVIEVLGRELSINPSFFRAHIVDYAWNNIRDPWREPPVIDIISQHRQWIQARFFRTRYFENEENLKQGQKEPNSFNIERRLDFDENEGWWDNDPDPDDGAESTSHTIRGKVALMRSRVSLWAEEQFAVLLVDPSIQGGYPLWRNSPNWEAPLPFKSFKDAEVPDSSASKTSPAIPSSSKKGAVSITTNPSALLDINSSSNTSPATHRSWYDQFIHFATRPDAFRHCHTRNSREIPFLALMHLICEEWLTMTDYINARLNQIDWEIARPDYFSPMKEREYALEKLHIWRRIVPLCRQMLGETLRHVFHSEGLVVKLSSVCAPSGEKKSVGFLEQTIPFPVTPFLDYKQDYQVALGRMDECQKRIDCLTSVVTAAISIEDAQRSFRNSKNIGHLTILATLFIPPSFYATLFSMTSDPLSSMTETLKWWAAASFPTVVLLVVVSLGLRQYPLGEITAEVPYWLRQGAKPRVSKDREVDENGDGKEENVDWSRDGNRQHEIKEKGVNYSAV